MPDLGEYIKERRRELKMTQQQVADKAGVSRSSVAGIETGVFTPSLRTLKKLARVLHISGSEISAILLVDKQRKGRKG